MAEKIVTAVLIDYNSLKRCKLICMHDCLFNTIDLLIYLFSDFFFPVSIPKLYKSIGASKDNNNNNNIPSVSVS